MELGLRQNMPEQLPRRFLDEYAEPLVERLWRMLALELMLSCIGGKREGRASWFGLDLCASVLSSRGSKLRN